MFADKTSLGGGVQGREMGMKDEVSADFADPEFAHIPREKKIQAEAGLEDFGMGRQRLELFSPGRESVSGPGSPRFFLNIGHRSSTKKSRIMSGIRPFVNVAG
jgi:hypothetical protein